MVPEQVWDWHFVHTGVCFSFFVCFLSPLVWFFLWLPEEVLALLFLLHRENGDFSILMKDIICFKFNYNLIEDRQHVQHHCITSGLLKGYVQGVEDSKHYPLCSTFYSFGLLCFYRSQLIKCSLPSQSHCSFTVDAMDIFCIHYAFQVVEDIRLATHTLLLSFVLSVEQIVICLWMTFGSW
jgi:hypothetical protein